MNEKKPGFYRAGWARINLGAESKAAKCSGVQTYAHGANIEREQSGKAHCRVSYNLQNPDNHGIGANNHFLTPTLINLTLLGAGFPRPTVLDTDVHAHALECFDYMVMCTAHFWQILFAIRIFQFGAGFVQFGQLFD